MDHHAHLTFHRKESLSTLNSTLYYVNNAIGNFGSPVILANDAKDGSIAVDKNDYVHIAYDFDLFSPKVQYTTNIGGSFIPPITVSPGNNPSLALNDTGVTHIVFHSNNEVFHTSNSTGNFGTPKNVSQGPGDFAQIALDNEGIPHISFHVFSSPTANLVLIPAS